jgi:hypothetical protein
MLRTICQRRSAAAVAVPNLAAAAIQMLRCAAGRRFATLAMCVLGAAADGASVREARYQVALSLVEGIVSMDVRPFASLRRTHQGIRSIHSETFDTGQIAATALNRWAVDFEVYCQLQSYAQPVCD